MSASCRTVTAILALIIIDVSLVHAQDPRNICHPDQYQNLVNNNISAPWFASIATTTEYDQSWPSWTTDEQAAYENRSEDIVISLGSISGGVHNPKDIRAHYGAIDKPGDIKSALQCELDPQDMPTATARDRVDKQLCIELNVL
eukprot:141371_1